jgi:hypothetical protein
VEWLVFLGGSGLIAIGWFHRRGGFERTARVLPRSLPEGWDVYVFRASDRLMQEFNYEAGPAASQGRGKGRVLAQWYAGLGRRFLALLPVVARACRVDTASAYAVVRHDRGGPYLLRVSDGLTHALATEDYQEFVAKMQESPDYEAWLLVAPGVFRQRPVIAFDATVLSEARLAVKHSDGLYVWMGPRTSMASPRLRTFADQMLESGRERDSDK